MWRFNDMDKFEIKKEVKKMKPVWSDFIVSLGYTKEKGDKFAEGYENELKKLPIFEKIDALSHQHDKCMETGFIFASINEDEAYQKANAI